MSGQYPLEESGGPLSQMSEAVNNIDRPKTSSDDMHAGGGHMNLKVRNLAQSECHPFPLLTMYKARLKGGG